MDDESVLPPPPPHSVTSLPVELQDMIKPYLSRHDLTLCVQVCKSWHDLFIDSLWHSVHTSFRNGYQGLRSIQEFKKTAEGASSPLFTRHIQRIRNLTVTHTSLHELFCEPQSRPILSANTNTSGDHDDECKKRNNLLVTEFSSSLSLTNLSVDFNDDHPSLPSFRPVNYVPSSGELPVFGTEAGSSPFGSWFTAAPLETRVGDIGVDIPFSSDFMQPGITAPMVPSAQPSLFAQFGESTNAVNTADDGTAIPIASFPTPTPKLASIDITSLLQILERSKDLKWFAINIAPLLSRAQFKDLNRIMDSLPIGLETLTLRNQTVGFGSPLVGGSFPMDTNTTLNSSDTDNQGPKILKELKSLSIERNFIIVYHGDGTTFDPQFDLIMKLMDHCPVLEELNAFEEDEKLEKILFKNAKNWKTLAGCPGPLSADIIAQDCPRLENFKSSNGSYFSSRHIQQLLCSATNLKRLDLLPKFGCSDHSAVFKAKEIVESKQDWVCLELESFKCLIGGIPRPDLKTQSNGRPLGELHDPNRYSTAQSRVIQRKVLNQLGRLTKLCEITLGLDNLDEDSGNHVLYWGEEVAQGEYFDRFDIQQNRQYACLTLSMDDGLELLKDLKKMRRLRVDGMSVLMTDDRERAWIKENWPEYRKGCKDKFWTNRGLSMPKGGYGGSDPPRRQEMFVEDQYEREYFDWW